MADSTLLFVYGSLRRGQRHHDELAGAEFVGNALTTCTYHVVEAHGYPALVPGQQAVAGELYRVSAQHIVALDRFEGPDYERKSLELAGGTRAEAYFLRRG